MSSLSLPGSYLSDEVLPGHVNLVLQPVKMLLGLHGKCLTLKL